MTQWHFLVGVFVRPGDAGTGRNSPRWWRHWLVEAMLEPGRPGGTVCVHWMLTLWWRWDGLLRCTSMPN